MFTECLSWDQHHLVALTSWWPSLPLDCHTDWASSWNICSAAWYAQKLHNWKPVWLLRNVGDVVFYSFSSLMIKHILEVECHTFQKRLPSLTSFRPVHLTIGIFLGDCVSLSLHSLVPELVCFIQKKVCIEPKDMCPNDISLCLCVIPYFPVIVEDWFGCLVYK